MVLDLRSAGCVYAEDEARLLMEKFDGSLIERAIARRVEGIPLEHLLGWADFGGLRIAVEPGVFVPRRRTRLLVEQAAPLMPHTVLDVCCGSGAVGVALAHAVTGLSLHAVDIEPAAVRCARRNVEPVGGHVYQGDLYEPLPDALRGGVDVLVANAPYVPTSAIGSMPSEARDHEPRSALDGGADGLDVQRRIVTGAGPWLAPGGQLLIETSVAQAEGTARIVEAAGFRAAVVHCDKLDGTVVVGNLSAPGEHRAGGEHR
ncbi:MAG: putative protein N(5)-glutamine methyltransferase [Rhodococcus sp. (in: high G+C Gram-positive bacteria)]